jgi:virginiamycin B lyase
LVEKGGSKSKHFQKKKLVVFVVLAIIAIIGISLVYSSSISSGPSQEGTKDVSELVSGSRADAVEKFNAQFCGLNSHPNSSYLVIEYPLPALCEMPLGIGVDSQNQNIWYVSTKNGTLGRYDMNTNTFGEEYKIPSWPARENPTMSSQVWDLDIDNKGNIWFTDEILNALWRFSNDTRSFEIFTVPEKPEAFGTTYPVSMEIDNNGSNIYFVGIRSPSIWIGNISQMRNGTAEGIERIGIPLDSFKGIDPDLVSTGSVVLDEDNDRLFVSLLAFNTKGQILGYDLKNNSFTSYEMPDDITSPVGLALDINDSLWVTDHGTSIFFRLDPASGDITKFTTSTVSPRTLGQSTTIDAAYTLPYWIKTGENGTIWFNQHTGNKMSSFNPNNLTLIEYWIPSQNKLWGPCRDDVSQCGISNALQFDVDENNEVWFSEWSENKIGRVLTDRVLPISVSVLPHIFTLQRGGNEEVRINVTSNRNTTLTADMLAAGSFTTTGNLGNLSGLFSENSVRLEPGQTKQVSLIITPTQELEAGNYTLMVGAETSDASVLRAIQVSIPK